jgi:glycosyltransferase involved in cell wall biosynthesis
MRIAFLDYTTKLSTVRDLETRARGGMVSSLFIVSDGLSRKGHSVLVLSDIAQEGDTEAGTRWRNECDHGESFDVLVLNRGIGSGYAGFPCRRRVLWTHDTPHSGFAPEPRNFRGIDLVVFMSTWGERVWRAYYPQIGKGAYIPNGVDLDRFRPAKEKDLSHFVYASAPNRGLRFIPMYADLLKEVCPETRVTAYSNMRTMHPGETPMDDVGDWSATSATLKDPIPQDQFARTLAWAGGLLLPTDYPEICSNVVLQALACGTPVFTTGGLGATPEWVRHGRNGMLTEWYPHDGAVHQMNFGRNLVRVAKDRMFHVELVKGATKTRGILPWQKVCDRWERALRSLC